MPENEWIWLALAPRLIGTPDAALRLQQAWMRGDLRLRGVRHAIPETDEVVEVPASEASRFTLDCLRSRIVRLSSQGRRRLWAYHSVQVRKADVERLAQEADENPAPAEEVADERLAQEAGENGAPAATAPQQPQLAEQIDDERLAREPEMDASPLSREDIDASVGEAGAGAAPAREEEEEAAPTAAANTPISEALPEQPHQAASDADILEAKDSQFVKEVAFELKRLCPGGRPTGAREVIFRDLRKRTSLAFEITTMDRAFRLLRWTRRRAKAR